VRGYRETGGGDLVAVVTYNALIALAPTFLLLVSVAGLVLRQNRALATAIEAIAWALPRADARDALQAILTARRNSGWFGAFSLLGFAWIGTNFVSALARCMNRVYGVPSCGFVCERRRGFVVIFTFAVLFLVAALAAAVPTLFVWGDLGPYFATWALAGGRVQLLGYGVALAAAVLLFLVLYRVIPNAGQRLGDVWPGALVAGVIFVGLTQAFPLYLRFFGGGSRYGQAFGLVWLLVTWFAALAHVLLFGTYVNATYRRHCLRKQGAPGDAPTSCP
jgi:membrane protein